MNIAKPAIVTQHHIWRPPPLAKAHAIARHTEGSHDIHEHHFESAASITMPGRHIFTFIRSQEITPADSYSSQRSEK